MDYTAVMVLLLFHEGTDVIGTLQPLFVLPSQPLFHSRSELICARDSQMQVLGVAVGS